MKPKSRCPRAAGRWGTRLRRWARDPLFVFLLIGVGVFALEGSWRGDPSRRIVITQAEVARFARLWETQAGRSPTAAELEALIDDHVREEILVREARRLRLDEDDVIVRRRLAQKLSFLTEDTATLTPPDDAALLAYFERNRSRYDTPAVVTFRHIYFSPDRREDAAADASRQLATLDPEQWRTTGDPFMLGRAYTHASLARVGRDFGPGFAETVAGLPADGVWRGPVASGYGVHLVRVDARTAAGGAVYQDVAARVAADLDAERREDANKAYFESLQAQYTVERP